MTFTDFGMINPIAETERIADASPNTGRTLAGTAGATSLQKKLRKKEDDMRSRPARRLIHAVSNSAKDTPVSRRDAESRSSREDRTPRAHIDIATGEDEEAFEPFIGVLVDYTA